jgi:hypothetical protein
MENLIALVILAGILTMQLAKNVMVKEKLSAKVVMAQERLNNDEEKQKNNKSKGKSRRESNLKWDALTQ